MNLLSHPFRLEPNGSVATVEDGTDEAHAEGLAILALTRRGERTLVPEFGIPDPLFDEVTMADLNVGLLDYGPPIEVTDLTTTEVTDTLERITITFDDADDGEEF